MKVTSMKSKVSLIGETNVDETTPLLGVKAAAAAISVVAKNEKVEAVAAAAPEVNTPSANVETKVSGTSNGFEEKTKEISPEDKALERRINFINEGPKYLKGREKEEEGYLKQISTIERGWISGRLKSQLVKKMVKLCKQEQYFTRFKVFDLYIECLFKIKCANSKNPWKGKRVSQKYQGLRTEFFKFTTELKKAVKPLLKKHEKVSVNNRTPHTNWNITFLKEILPDTEEDHFSFVIHLAGYDNRTDIMMSFLCQLQRDLDRYFSEKLK